METAFVALTRTNIEGVLATIAAFVLFCGSIYVLVAAVFGNRMGYLVTATAFFAFMIVLSALWVFGAPGTPRFLGPKGTLPSWIAIAQGQQLRSEQVPIEQYPSGPWKEPTGGQAAEEEPATLAFQDFLAAQAGEELSSAGLEGELEPDDFVIEDVRFTEVDGKQVAAATAFAEGGGPQVTVVGYKDPGNEPLPSYLFLAASVIGFVGHLPLLDRAERRRKEVLTGGDQPAWRGPA